MCTTVFVPMCLLISFLILEQTETLKSNEKGGIWWQWWFQNKVLFIYSSLLGEVWAVQMDRQPKHLSSPRCCSFPAHALGCAFIDGSTLLPCHCFLSVPVYRIDFFFWMVEGVEVVAKCLFCLYSVFISIFIEDIGILQIISFVRRVFVVTFFFKFSLFFLCVCDT